MSSISESAEFPADERPIGARAAEGESPLQPAEGASDHGLAAVLPLNPRAEKSAPPVRGTPTADRVVLGERLRRARDRRGLSQERAAAHGKILLPESKLSYSTLSRIESAKTPVSGEIVATLAEVYGIDSRELRELQDLVERGRQLEWFEAPEWEGAVAAHCSTYLGLEPVARELRSYQTTIIPGLLQTPDYACGIIAGHHLAVDEKRAEHRVRARMERQRRFFASPPARTVLVINELALQLTIGGPAVMAAQVRHLLHVADMPSVKVRVVPLDQTIATPVSGLTHLMFQPEGPPEMVYIEGLSSSTYHPADTGEPSARKKVRKGKNASADMESYVQLMLKISQGAAHRRRSMDILTQALKRFEGR
ncbi:helix-turn-helix transcriptional regulator [Kitasatospora sp. NPDC058478]|uniref:helix-turn-helix domain-containing protein n=1 Tax=unclassified Kitasatospora TaxID=2633591 RepID=UPI00366713F7